MQLTTILGTRPNDFCDFSLRVALKRKAFFQFKNIVRNVGPGTRSRFTQRLCQTLSVDTGACPASTTFVRHTSNCR